jgi:hypothetical protein
MRGILEHRSLVLSFSLFVAACSGAAGKNAEAPAAVTLQGVQVYLPLEDGTVFSYETRVEPSGEQGLLVLEVRRRHPDAAELVVAGRSQRLSVRADALELVTGGYLLKEPLSSGAEFRGNFGTVRITRVGFAASVPAGKFDDCVETVESTETQTASRVTTTIYCARVGIVSRTSEAETEEGQARESMKLRSFGKKFDLGLWKGPAPR